MAGLKFETEQTEERMKQFVRNYEEGVKIVSSEDYEDESDDEYFELFKNNCKGNGK